MTKKSFIVAVKLIKKIFNLSFLQCVNYYFLLLYSGCLSRDWNMFKKMESFINYWTGIPLLLDFPPVLFETYIIFVSSAISKFKACVRYFLSNCYFSPNHSPWKTMKNVFISSKNLFSFLRFSNFCIFVFSSFFSLPAIALEVDSRKILKFMTSSTV